MNGGDPRGEGLHPFLCVTAEAQGWGTATEQPLQR
jgi:hypothetical protein